MTDWIGKARGGEKNLRGASLRGANLLDADLCGADLCGALGIDEREKRRDRSSRIDRMPQDSAGS